MRPGYYWVLVNGRNVIGYHSGHSLFVFFPNGKIIPMDEATIKIIQEIEEPCASHEK